MQMAVYQMGASILEHICLTSQMQQFSTAQKQPSASKLMSEQLSLEGCMQAESRARGCQHVSCSWDGLGQRDQLNGVPQGWDLLHQGNQQPVLS